MKTSLIQLSQNPDWRAAVARIRGGAQGRVILVWPAKGGPRSPRLVLQLMQRRSLRKRVPLAVVTSVAFIRTEASTLELPLFSNTREARSAEWGLSQPIPGSAPLHPRTSKQDLRAEATNRRAAARI